MRGRPEDIKDTVDKILGRIEQGAGKEDISAAWRAAAGSRAAKHAEVVMFRKGVMTVAVDDSAWLYQLTIDKKGIIETANKRLRDKIADIKFRIK